MLAAVERACPRSAPPARELLGRLCRGWGCEQGALPAHSLLTASGVPLEFGFRGGADEIRYTADPGAPGSSPRAQWQAITELLPQARSIGPRLSRVTGLPAAQDGLWLGIRHRGPATVVKLYQRVPCEQAGRVTDVLTRAPFAAGGNLIPVLAGAGSDGALEIYARMPGPSRASVHAVLCRAEAAAAFGPVELCLADLRGRSPAAAWDELRVGVSRCLVPGRDAVTTVFFHGVELFGNDQVARERLLALADRLGAGLSGYREASAAPFPGRPSPAHGIIGLSAQGDGRVGITITVAAVGRGLAAGQAAVDQNLDRMPSATFSGLGPISASP